MLFKVLAYRNKDFIRSKKIQSFEGFFWSFIGFTKLKIRFGVCFNADAV